MTVGEMRQRLAQYPESAIVLLWDDENGDIEAVQVSHSRQARVTATVVLPPRALDPRGPQWDISELVSEPFAVANFPPGSFELIDIVQIS